MPNLAKWQSHKVVTAAKILRLPIMVQDDKAQSTGWYSVRVEDANGEGENFECRGEVFARGFPSVGDYLVIYEDGYISWSPARAFEEGYTRMQTEAA